MPSVGGRRTRGNHGGHQVKINKWTRRHADARPPEETVAKEQAASQAPDGLSEAGGREAGGGGGGRGGRRAARGGGGGEKQKKTPPPTKKGERPHADRGRAG